MFLKDLTNRLASCMFTVKPHGNVDARHYNHASVQNASPSFKIARFLHFLLKGQHESDAFEREHGGAEEQRQTAPATERRPLANRWQSVAEYVVKHDHDAAHLEDVRHDRDRCQML